LGGRINMNLSINITVETSMHRTAVSSSLQSNTSALHHQ